MKKIMILSLVLTFTFCMFFMVLGQQNQTKFYLLNDLKVENNTVKILTSEPIKYNIFKISNPPRLVIELFNTEHALKQKELNVENNIIKRIRSGQFQNEPKIARVVIDLEKMVDYKATQKENQIILEIEPTETKTDIAQKPKQEESQEKETPAVSTGTQKTEQPKEEVKTEPVKQVAPAPAPKALPELTTPTKKETVSKKTKSEEKTSSKKTGIVLPKTPITLEYVDADIQDVLQVMAIRSGVNIIYGPDVTGTVTVSLKNVPFDQAFNTILALKGLTTLQVGDNILRVLTPAALTDERQKEITYTKIFPLNYASASTVQSQVTNVLSARELKGIITVDDRTNSLIVTASQEGLDAVEKLLKELDVKPQQVMIEAKVVDVNLSDLTELGVSWSYENIATKADGGTLTQDKTYTIGPIDVERKISETGVGRTEATGAKLVGPVPASGGIFSFGFITNREVFNAQLAALATQGKMKVLSNPKVTTINNKEAKILVGEKVPYKTTTIGQGGVSQESWQFLDAGIQLSVKPTISPDGWITMDVKPVVSVPLAAAGGQAPTVRTRETSVTVMVKDMDTLVIGGLISDSDMDSISKIPLLGDLPILGYLFKYKSKQKTRTELLVFITPKILKD